MAVAKSLLGGPEGGWGVTRTDTAPAQSCPAVPAGTLPRRNWSPGDLPGADREKEPEEKQPVSAGGSRFHGADAGEQGTHPGNSP